MMFELFCAGCHRRYLLGTRCLQDVQNLASGAILLEFACPRGHNLLLMTGRTHRRSNDRP